jgi:hypothetical protein
MGLDWNPTPRAKPGSEAKFERLMGIDLDEIDDVDREATIARIHAISETPFETIGAPRVGYDPRADSWLAERLREKGTEHELDHVRQEMHGYYVLDLMPDVPGLPVYSSFGYHGVDRYTFRGQFLDDVRQIIGNDLYERVWHSMDAPELQAYGQALLHAGREYARQHGLEALENQREIPAGSDPDSPDARAHIIFSAGNWCVWWARHGHGLEPYY